MSEGHDAKQRKLLEEQFRAEDMARWIRGGFASCVSRIDPLSNRAWIASAESRRKHIGGCVEGSSLEAPQRERKMRVYRAEFDEERCGVIDRYAILSRISSAEFPPLFAYEKANALFLPALLTGKPPVRNSRVLAALVAFCESISGSILEIKENIWRVSLNVDVRLAANELYEAQPLLWAAVPRCSHVKKGNHKHSSSACTTKEQKAKKSPPRDPLKELEEKNEFSGTGMKEDNKLDDGNRRGRILLLLAPADTNYPGIFLPGGHPTPAKSPLRQEEYLCLK